MLQRSTPMVRANVVSAAWPVAGNTSKYATASVRMPITARCQNSLENQGSRSCLIGFILLEVPDGHVVWDHSGKNRAAGGGFADRRTPTPPGKGLGGIAEGCDG
ncbi:hypothetical protein GCM10009080_38390 [Cupriavidus pauculus]